MIVVPQSISLTDIDYKFSFVYSILSCTLHIAVLCTQLHTGNLNHRGKTLLLGTGKKLVLNKGIAHHQHLMLAKTRVDCLWKLCSELGVSCSSTSTNNRALGKHSHPRIADHQHIWNIARTYAFDKILSNIYKHGIQQRNQSLFLLNLKRFIVLLYERLQKCVLFASKCSTQESKSTLFLFSKTEGKCWLIFSIYLMFEPLSLQVEIFSWDEWENSENPLFKIVKRHPPFLKAMISWLCACAPECASRIYHTCQQ